jgi:nitroimidazol reductase NimA-like FMN-containing flavoprotein (pyridoxamine 5'-phosphate oxidase superfamily)
MENAASLARDVIDANQYLVLGTADPDGRPWTTPVYFAHHDMNPDRLRIRRRR